MITLAIWLPSDLSGQEKESAKEDGDRRRNEVNDVLKKIR